MARHQPPGRIAGVRLAWLLTIMFGALAGCSPDSTARNPVDATAASASVPTDRQARSLAAEGATRIEAVSVPEPSPSEPVTAVMITQPNRASVGETVELLVHIRIASEHFIHAKDDPGSPFVPVAMKTTLPEGVETTGDWQVPKPQKGHGTALVYRDSLVLRRSLRVVSSSAPKSLTIVGELQYQVCTDELCWPQGKLKLSAPLTIQSQGR